MTSRTSSTTARPLAPLEKGATAQPSLVVAPTFLTLPIPPSVNDAYANRKGKGRGRVLTGKAIDWKLHAGHVLKAQRPQHFTCPVLIIVNVERRSAMADVDNRMKLLFDLLVSEDVIVDDRFITGFATAWSPNHSERLHLAIMPVGPLAITFQPSQQNGAVGGWIIQAPEHEEKDAE
jgi:Holliday junction resolvase RusA-like endonuclease